MSIEEVNKYQEHIYMELIKAGYKLHEIDALDIHYCMKLLFSGSNSKKVYIDDIL